MRSNGSLKKKESSMLVEMTMSADLSQEQIAEMLGGRSYQSLNATDFEVFEEKMINELDVNVKVSVDGQSLGSVCND